MHRKARVNTRDMHTLVVKILHAVHWKNAWQLWKMLHTDWHSAVEWALEGADIMLIGADAVDEDGVFNKIGSATFAKLAHQKGIPVYVCTTSFKVDERKDVIEIREPGEIWNKKNHNLHVINPAFDKTEMKYITGIVSEFGILKPKVFFKKALKNFQTFK